MRCLGRHGCNGSSRLRAVVALTTANYHGISRTAALARVLVAGSIAALLVVVGAIVAGGEAHCSRIGGGSGLHAGGVYGCCRRPDCCSSRSPATRGSRRSARRCAIPTRTIPRAIPLALGIVVVLYLVVALAALDALPDRCPRGEQPGRWRRRWTRSELRGLRLSSGSARRSASLGALLALIAGVGRTGLAMARNGDLPRWLDVGSPASPRAGSRRARSRRRRRRCWC